MSNVTTYFVSALGLSLMLTPICRLLARRFDFVSKPRQDRWHKTPTALFGGVAIALPILGLGLTMPRQPGLWELLSGGALIAGLGLVDDALSVKASTKLIAQIVVASMLVFVGYRLHWTQSMVGDAMLTLFWIVGITNAFNLLDNMDGLCGGTAMIAATFLLIAMVDSGNATPLAAYAATLIGATAGFMAYNVYPASIFMGDTGSLFLGLNLAALTVSPIGSRDLLSIVGAPVLLLLVPIFDTLLVTILRLLSRRRPSQGGRDHTSHRLVAVGLSESRAVVTLWALATAGGAISVLLTRHPTWAIIGAVMFLLA